MSDDPYELDPFLKTYVAPVMQESGFRKRGRRRWQIESARQDLVIVVFRRWMNTRLDFFVEWRVVPRALREYVASLPGSEGRDDAVVSMRWCPPSSRRPPGDQSMWRASNEAELSLLGDALNQELRNNAVPFWLSMRDKRRVFEVLAAADEPGPPRAPLVHNSSRYGGADLAAVLLGMYDEDPHEMLRLVEAAAQYDQRPIVAWLRTRLTERIADVSRGKATT